MKIVKKQIVTFLAIMISIIMVQKHCFAKYDAENVEEMSISHFWKEVDSSWNVEDKVADERTAGNYMLLLSSKKNDRIEKATAVYTSGAFKKCEVLPTKLYDNRRCFFCSLITIMYAASNHITSLSFDTFAMPFAVVMAMGLALWIAVKVLDFVSSVSKQDAPKFLTELMKQSYKVIIAFFLLVFSGQIFDYIILDVLETGIDFGGEVVSYASADEDLKGAIVNNDMLTETDLNKLEELNPGITRRTMQHKLKKTTGTTYYDALLYRKIDNFIVFIQKNIAFVQSIGTSLLCIGGNAMIWRGYTLSWGDGFQLIIMGMLLAGFSFILVIAFAFYLVDAIVQLGIVGALLPFMIATWPFKITSKYSKIGWNMILNSAFIFLFSGIVATVDVALIDSAVAYSANQEETSSSDAAQKESSSSDTSDKKKGGLYDIAVAINTQSEYTLAGLTDISGVGFLILLFCCIYGFQFMGKASELAGKFAGGALKPIAPGIATMAGSATKSLALKSTQRAREAISEKFKNGKRAAWGGIKSMFKGGKNNPDPQAGKDTLSGKAGSSPGGTVTTTTGSPSPAAGTSSVQPQTKPTISEGGVNNKPVISEGDDDNKPVVSEQGTDKEDNTPNDNPVGADSDTGKNDNKDNGSVQSEEKNNKHQLNADKTNAKGSSRYVEFAQKKYDQYNKPKKKSGASKNKRKQIKTNKKSK